MIDIILYLKRSLEERHQHLRLDEPCVFRNVLETRNQRLKDLHGLSTKEVTYEMIYELAAKWGCSRGAAKKFILKYLQ